jgi:hypothetical protein
MRNIGSRRRYHLGCQSFAAFPVGALCEQATADKQVKTQGFSTIWTYLPPIWEIFEPCGNGGDVLLGSFGCRLSSETRAAAIPFTHKRSTVPAAWHILAERRWEYTQVELEGGILPTCKKRYWSHNRNARQRRQRNRLRTKILNSFPLSLADARTAQQTQEKIAADGWEHDRHQCTQSRVHRSRCGACGRYRREQSLVADCRFAVREIQHPWRVLEEVLKTRLILSRFDDSKLIQESQRVIREVLV